MKKNKTRRFKKRQTLAKVCEDFCAEFKAIKEGALNDRAMAVQNSQDIEKKIIDLNTKVSLEDSKALAFLKEANHADKLISEIETKFGVPNA